MGGKEGKEATPEEVKAFFKTETYLHFSFLISFVDTEQVDAATKKNLKLRSEKLENS
jgi:hypothetical protein